MGWLTTAVPLALAGLVSALLAAAIERRLGWGFPLCDALLFGVVIAAWFALRERARPVSKLLKFVAASGAACAASIVSIPLGLTLAGSLKPLYQEYPTCLIDPRPLVFVGGWAGAAVILSAGLRLFGPSARRSIAWPVAMSWVGGVLALGVTWTNSRQFLPPGLPVVWQTGVALLLGLLLSNRRARAAGVPEPRSMRLAKVGVVAGVVAVVALAAAGAGKGVAEGARRAYAEHRAKVERPSLDELPEVRRVEPGRMVIEENLGGWFFVGSGGAKPDWKWDDPPGPATIVYDASYEQRPGGAAGAPRPLAGVRVIQYPNAAWARYKARYPGTHAPRVTDPKFVTTTARLGQNLVVDRSLGPAGPPLLIWPSGSVLVTVIFFERNQLNEELLKRYLARYPSSL